MTKWVCQAVLDSFTVFFLPMAAYKDATTVWAERGYGDGLYVFGTTVYAGLIMAMMMKVFNMTNVSSEREGRGAGGSIFWVVEGGWVGGKLTLCRELNVL